MQNRLLFLAALLAFVAFANAFIGKVYEAPSLNDKEKLIAAPIPGHGGANPSPNILLTDSKDAG